MFSANLSKRSLLVAKSFNSVYGVTVSSTKNSPKSIIKKPSSKEWPSPPPFPSTKSVDISHHSNKIQSTSRKETLLKYNSVSMLMDSLHLSLIPLLFSLTKMLPLLAKKLMLSLQHTKQLKQLSD